jgi:uncharacterized protein DUF3866
VALSLRRGVVTAVHERHEGLARLDVDGEPCVAYPALTGPVALGDEVVVNTQARELGLGSGGFDVLYVNLTRGLGLAPEAGAHVMKLPYTPLQMAVRHAEEKCQTLVEDGSDGAAAVSDTSPLGGMPVVCCSVHSQVVPAFAALDGLRVAYVQLEGGALPLALSDAVRTLVASTASVGACFGGDVECVNAWSALAWAKRSGHEVAVCAIGPGIVGTGSRLGHGGLAAAAAANAAIGLGGRAVVAARVSEGDLRERHQGISHHTRAVLDLCLGDVVVGGEADADGWRVACEGLPLSHMGRGPDEDPAFFAAAYAAGAAARRLLT